MSESYQFAAWPGDIDLARIRREVSEADPEAITIVASWYTVGDPPGSKAVVMWTERGWERAKRVGAADDDTWWVRVEPDGGLDWDETRPEDPRAAPVIWAGGSRRTPRGLRDVRWPKDNDDPVKVAQYLAAAVRRKEHATIEITVSKYGTAGRVEN